MLPIALHYIYIARIKKKFNDPSVITLLVIGSCFSALTILVVIINIYILYILYKEHKAVDEKKRRKKPST